MKWWVFTDGHVAGPYSAETLGRRPSFNGHALVCEDPLAGEERPPWRRADSVPTLRALLEGRPFPPDPTLDDVADHRRLAERLSELESASRRNAAELKALAGRENQLRGELARKELALRELSRRLAAASSQAAAVEALEDGLRAVMEGLRGHEGEVRELGEQLKSLAGAANEAVDRADLAAAETAQEAAGALEAAKALVERSLKSARKALAKADDAMALAAEERAARAAGKPPKRRDRRPRPPVSGAELGLPDVTSVDPPKF
ncbi:hypothetical protein EPO15_02875 [bacterium]|nr:MAG: hypothetical protein EPO15_02875 [bacterium]